MIRRPKKDSVLVKHKKWLSDLQKTKEELEGRYLEEIKKKEDSQLRVRTYRLSFLYFHLFLFSLVSRA
jgi:hypothetical protein